MKINLTFELSDNARRYIGEMGDCKRLVDGMARRADCIAFITTMLHKMDKEQVDFMAELNKARREIYFSPLTPEQVEHCNQAIDYLRKAGKSDAGIKQWMLKQRAVSAVTLERLRS